MKRLLAALAAVLIITALPACSPGGGRTLNASDLAGKTVGVLKDSVSERLANRLGLDITLLTYADRSAMASELKSGSLDCVIADRETERAITGLFSGLKSTGEPLVDADYVLAVSAENRLMRQNLNSALSSIRSSGLMGSIVNGWLEDGGYSYDPGPAPDGAKQVIVAVDPTFFPYAFYDEEGELAGMEIDLTRAVCHELGLETVFLPVEPDMLLYFAQSGKCSFAIGRIPDGVSGDQLIYSSGYTHDTEYIVVRK